MTHTILFVGRLVERKGVGYLIDAVACLPPSLEAELVIIGDGPDRVALEARARASSGLSPIELRGWVTPGALDEAYRAATALVLPAVVDARGDTEGLGMVLLEAMSYGVPVIATALGGITDIVEDEVTGLIVPPNDARALALALARVIGDEALRMRLSAAAKRLVVERFGWPRILAQCVALYRGLDDHPRGGVV